VVNIYAVVLWVMTPSRLVGGYKCFEGTHHLTPDVPIEVSVNHSHNPEIHDMKVGSYSNALFSIGILELLGSNLISGHKLSSMRFVVFFCPARLLVELYDMKVGSYSNTLFSTGILELLGSNLISGHKLSSKIFVLFFCPARPFLE
jgi:hypothetical protein